jgi:hypothetical protein
MCPIRISWRFASALGAVAFWIAQSSTSAQTNFATLASDGAWTWYNDPRAAFHNGILYFGYARNADGETVLSAFNPQTGARTDLFTSTRTEKDDHNVPGLLVKQDGTMLAIYARHGTDQFFAYRYSNSTNPISATNWSAEQTIAPTGARLTYANPFQLSCESGRVYNFTRDLNFNPTVFNSTNGGVTWSTPQLFIQTGTASIRPYVKYCSDYAQRIDFLYTDGHPHDVTNSLYHLYYQSGSLFKTDGSFLKSFANLPVLHDSGERGSVIYQYSDTDTSDFQRPHSHRPRMVLGNRVSNQRFACLCFHCPTQQNDGHKLVRRSHLLLFRPLDRHQLAKALHRPGWASALQH